MNKLKQTVGFFLEAMSFVMSGFLIARNLWEGFVILILAFILAYLVGKQIEADAIEEENNKWK